MNNNTNNKVVTTHTPWSMYYLIDYARDEKFCSTVPYLNLELKYLILCRIFLIWRCHIATSTYIAYFNTKLSIIITRNLQSVTDESHTRILASLKNNHGIVRGKTTSITLLSREQLTETSYLICHGQTLDRADKRKQYCEEV